MLLLLFYSGNDCFGIEANEIIEVSPLVDLIKLPHSEASVSGLMKYRGSIVPVIDFSFIIKGKVSRELFSSKIILCNYKSNQNENHILGLLAERVIETISCKAEDFKKKGIDIEDAKYLGDILITDNATIQKIELKSILNQKLKASLFNSVVVNE